MVSITPSTGDRERIGCGGNSWSDLVKVLKSWCTGQILDLLAENHKLMSFGHIQMLGSNN